MDIISNTGIQQSGSKVVLGGGISLDDVSSLSSNVDVEDTGSSLHTTGSGSNVVDVRSVLEGSSELGGIQSQLMRSTILSDDFIVLNRGVISVGSPVNETSIGSVSIGAEIGGGDVISDSEGTVAVILSNAFLILRGGESDVDGVEVSVGTRSQMVFSGPWSLDTEGRGHLPRGLFHPSSSFGGAFDGVVLGLSNVGFQHLAISLGFDVLGFLLVEFAIRLVGSEDGNISPGRRMPVGIIISFLGAFITLSVSVVVLTGEDGGSSSSVKVSFFLTIGNKETHVSFSVLAILIVLVRLVHSVEEISVSVNSNGSVEIVGDGLR